MLPPQIHDADTGSLALHQGTTAGGSLIGSVVGTDASVPDGGTDTFWYGLGDDRSVDNTITIGSQFYSDLADGRFDVYGQDVNSLGSWGSNRALLIITYAPEPGTLLLGLAGGLLALGRRSRARA